MIGKYRKQLASCVVFAVGVFVAISQHAVARPVACCDEWNDCVNGIGVPQVCPSSCPADHQICSSSVGPCGDDMACQYEPCVCDEGIPEGCCLLAGGQPSSGCIFGPQCLSESEPVEGVSTDRVDHSLPEDQWMEEAATAPTSGTSWWVFAIPLFLILPAVPVLIRRRRRTS